MHRCGYTMTADGNCRYSTVFDRDFPLVDNNMHISITPLARKVEYVPVKPFNFITLLISGPHCEVHCEDFRPVFSCSEFCAWVSRCINRWIFVLRNCVTCYIYLFIYLFISRSHQLSS